MPIALLGSPQYGYDTTGSGVVIPGSWHTSMAGVTEILVGFVPYAPDGYEMLDSHTFIKRSSDPSLSLTLSPGFASPTSPIARYFFTGVLNVLNPYEDSSSSVGTTTTYNYDVLGQSVVPGSKRLILSLVNQNATTKTTCTVGTRIGHCGYADSSHVGSSAGAWRLDSYLDELNSVTNVTRVMTSTSWTIDAAASFLLGWSFILVPKEYSPAISELFYIPGIGTSTHSFISGDLSLLCVRGSSGTSAPSIPGYSLYCNIPAGTSPAYAIYYRNYDSTGNYNISISGGDYTGVYGFGLTYAAAEIIPNGAGTMSVGTDFSSTTNLLMNDTVTYLNSEDATITFYTTSSAVVPRISSCTTGMTSCIIPEMDRSRYDLGIVQRSTSSKYEKLSSTFVSTSVVMGAAVSGSYSTIVIRPRTYRFPSIRHESTLVGTSATSTFNLGEGARTGDIELLIVKGDNYSFSSNASLGISGQVTDGSFKKVSSYARTVPSTPTGIVLTTEGSWQSEQIYVSGAQWPGAPAQETLEDSVTYTSIPNLGYGSLSAVPGSLVVGLGLATNTSWPSGSYTTAAGSTLQCKDYTVGGTSTWTSYSKFRHFNYSAGTYGDTTLTLSVADRKPTYAVYRFLPKVDTYSVGVVTCSGYKPPQGSASSSGASKCWAYGYKTIQNPGWVSPSGTGVGGTGAISVAAPSGVKSGDLELLFVETANQAVTTPSGWTLLGSQQGTGTAASTTASLLAIFYRVSTGSTATVSVADAGDHTIAARLAFRNVDTTNPFNASVGTVTATSSTSVYYGALTTTRPNCLIVAACTSMVDTSTGQHSSTTAANASVAFSNVINYANVSGNGGGICVSVGTKSAAGQVSDGTTTTNYVRTTLATTSVSGAFLIALNGRTGGNYGVSGVGIVTDTGEVGPPPLDVYGTTQSIVRGIVTDLGSGKRISGAASEIGRGYFTGFGSGKTVSGSVYELGRGFFTGLGRALIPKLAGGSSAITVSDSANMFRYVLPTANSSQSVVSSTDAIRTQYDQASSLFALSSGCDISNTPVVSSSSDVSMLSQSSATMYAVADEALSAVEMQCIGTPGLLIGADSQANISVNMDDISSRTYRNGCVKLGDFSSDSTSGTVTIVPTVTTSSISFGGTPTQGAINVPFDYYLFDGVL